MNANPLLSGFYGVVHVLLALVVSPLLEGIVRRLTARIQSRKGPPLVQPYVDILKLLGKEDVESGEVPGVQRLAAYLSLATTLAIATLLPMGGPIPLAGAADAILLIYLLTLAGFATLLAGLAAGSPYSVVGMSRGMMAMLVLEPVLAVSILVAAVETGSLGLPAVLAASVYSADAAPLAGLLVLGVLLLALQAFVERVPFDTAEAETEIMEGALLEYSGPKLALFRYARGVRLYVYVVLVVSLVSPLGRGLSPLLGFLVCLGQVFALILLVTAVAATHARYRIDQAIRYYASLLALGVGALVLALAGF